MYFRLFYGIIYDIYTQIVGEVCEIINGFAFKSQLFKNIGDDILRISNIHNGVVDVRDIGNH